MNKYFERVINGETLTEDEMMETMRFIMDGRGANEDLAPFLTALSERGETVDEITGAARVLRERAITIKSPKGAVDCCGTGGDRTGTYKISTAVAFVAASCDAPVAKHGNRSSSSRSGAADVLEMLGVNLSMTPEAQEEALKTVHFVFLHASKHHPAMKHVAVVRKKLGIPTIFNLLGPLANPANAKRQLIGVYDRKWVLPIAEALKRLGTERAWVAHGADGLDEISISGETHIAIIENGKITEKTLTPKDFGLQPKSVDDLKGGDVKENANALRAVLEGKKSAYRDIILVNAAAVLNIHGSAQDLIDGVDLAQEALDSGLALQTMKDYIVFSRDPAHMAKTT